MMRVMAHIDPMRLSLTEEEAQGAGYRHPFIQPFWLSNPLTHERRNTGIHTYKLLPTLSTPASNLEELEIISTPQPVGVHSLQLSLLEARNKEFVMHTPHKAILSAAPLGDNRGAGPCKVAYFL